MRRLVYGSNLFAADVVDGLTLPDAIGDVNGDCGFAIFHGDLLVV
jgi:hypothetical protein